MPNQIGYNNQLSETGGCGSCKGGKGKKRKPTAYNLFVKKEMKVLQKQHPSKSAPELMKLIGKKWQEHKH